VPELDRLSPDARHAALESLKVLAPRLSDLQRAPLWKALRELLSEHREFPDAEWVMKEPDLEALEGAYDLMAPSDETLRRLWLFEDHPKLGTKVDWEAYGKILEGKRAAAITDMLDSLGIEGVAALSERVALPWALGWTVGASAIGNEQIAALLRDPDQTPARKTMLNAVFASRLNRDGNIVAQHLGLEQLEAERRGELGASLRFGGETWDLVESWGAASSRAYWLRASPHFLRDPDRDGTRALESLLGVERPHAALDFAATLVHQRKKNPPVSVDLIARALENAGNAAPASEPPGPLASAWDIGQLFDVLVHGKLDATRLSKLEWAWFQVLRNSRHQCKTLFARHCSMRCPAMPSSSTAYLRSFFEPRTTRSASPPKMNAHALTRVGSSSRTGNAYLGEMTRAP
jgi:hypothetical protein